MRSRLLTAFFVLEFTLVACHTRARAQGHAEDPKRSADAKKPATSEPEFPFTFNEDFEGNELGPGWNRFAITPPASLKNQKMSTEEVRRAALQSRNLSLVKSPVRKGSQALQITVYPDDAHAPGDEEKGKSRADIGIQNVSKAGSEGWYSWSVLIPEDYADAPPGPKPFQILTQFHRYTLLLDHQYVDGNQLSKSEKDDANSTSPAITVQYANPTGNQPVMILEYGLTEGKQPRKTWETPIKKGQWIDWQLHIKWSVEDDGFIEAWVNEKLLARQPGRNLYTDLPVDVRWGIYRGHHKYTTTNRIIIDDIRIAPTKSPAR